MSHSYPHRRPPSDMNLRHGPGPCSSSDSRHPSLDRHHTSSDRRHVSSDRHHASQDRHSCRSPPESFSSSHQSSSRTQRAGPDSALSILSSCGLEPGDLSLLAKLPDDALTMESLPQVLQRLKGKRRTIKPFATNTPPSSSCSSSAYPHSSTHRYLSSSPGNWVQSGRGVLQCPRGQVKPTLLLPDLDRWGNPMTFSSARAGPPPPSLSPSCSYMMDHSTAPGRSRYSKTGWGGRPSADYRSAAPPEEQHSKPTGGRSESDCASCSSRSSQPPGSTPSKKEALDFHGKIPPVYPYSCTLCDVTVMSEKVWLKHINGTHHADGQLRLLQRFPHWDCRMEPESRDDGQSERRRQEGKPEWPPKTASRSSTLPTKAKSEKKAAEKSKVVCVKFPAQAVDEAFLRKLADPFGRIVKVLMFPSLAFMELGSVDQARDLVKFHQNQPPTFNGEQMEFSMSHTFSFLQSSRVISFSPTPSGESGLSDLMAVVERFGTPLYTLFLPSTAFVEMKDTADAQKLVDYYSSNMLKINDDSITVSFSREYRSLLRVAAANRYEGKTDSSRRMRSSSSDRGDGTKENRSRTQSRSSESSSETKRTRSGSRDTSHQRKRSRTRSKFRDRSTREDRTRSSSSERTSSRSRDTSRQRKRSRTRSKSSDGSTRENRTRSSSSERSSEEAPTRARSRSTDESSEDGRTTSNGRSRSWSRGESSVLENTDPTESRTVSEAAPVGDAPSEVKEDVQSSAESDIEGMEVIGEDGENLEDEDMETLDEAEREEEEDKMEEAAERADSSEEDNEKDVQDGEHQEEEKPAAEEETEEEKVLKEVCGRKLEEENEMAGSRLEDEQEEVDFPVDLETCITLDELEEDLEEDDATEEVSEASSEPSRKPSNDPGPPADTSSSRMDQTSGRGKRNEHRTGRRAGQNESNSTESFRKIPEKAKETGRSPEKRCASRSSSSEKTSTDGESVRNRRSGDTSGTSENRCINQKTTSSKTLEKDSMNKQTTEEESVPETQKQSRKTPDRSRDSSGTRCGWIAAEGWTSENQDSAEEPSGPEFIISVPSPEERPLKRRETHENGSGPEKKRRREESTSDKAATAQELNVQQGETSAPQLKDSQSPGQAAAPQAPGGQEPPAAAAEHPGMHRSEPAGGAAEHQKPAQPVGTEFVRPVVGYFCNLCQLIYADEDEAKLQHCSSPAHYRKYQEKTGRDPWSGQIV